MLVLSIMSHHNHSYCTDVSRQLAKSGAKLCQ